MSEAQEITRKAKSNLAFALLSLPKENRDDVTIFYAFCRVIDDIADDPNNPAEEKRIGLDHWQGLFHGEVEKPTQLEESILALQQRHSIPREHFLDLIEGCRMDLEPQRFETWSDLQTYTHRVASTVGLVCLPLFGSQHPEAPAYATKLGHALQLTNILRDVAEDLENENRVYLPLEDMRRFDYTEQDLRNRVYDERFQQMMHYQGQRATRLFAKTIALHPSSDRKSLMAAEIMRSLYQTLLERMQDDDFRVFDRRYKLSKARKIATLVTHGLRTHFAK